MSSIKIILAVYFRKNLHLLLAMALDIYCQEGEYRRLVRSIKSDDALSELIDRFNQTTGLNVDLYGTSRLYLAQWERLIQLAKSAGYASTELEQIRSELPDNYTEGILILEGD